MMAGMYRFLVTDFLNPFALPSGGPGSAEVYVGFDHSSFLDVVHFILIRRPTDSYMYV